MDLVDVFAVPSVPPSDRQWNASHPVDTDPWDSLGEWSRQRLFLLNITFVDEAHINEDIPKTIPHYTWIWFIFMYLQEETCSCSN